MLIFSLSLRVVKLKESLSSFSLSPDLIFQTLIAFWASKALMAAVELELFTKLSGGKQMTLNELQKALGMEARPTGVFASALASLGSLQVTKTEEGGEGLFANSRVSEMFLDKSKDSHKGDIITMFDMWGANPARRNAYRKMVERNFHSDFQGVAMHRPNEAAYCRDDLYLIDDWRYQKNF